MDIKINGSLTIPRSALEDNSRRITPHRGIRKQGVQDALFSFGCQVSIAFLTLSLLVIVYFLARTGFRVFSAVDPLIFFFSTDWLPENDQFGAASIIFGTFYLTFITLAIAGPISIGLAVFNAAIAPPWIQRTMRMVLDLLVGIPSVVYGYLGMTVLIPLIRTVTGEPMGDGMLVAALVLSLMVLPTISRISDDALTAVPRDYIEASYVLGATRTQTIFKVWIPAARNGIISAVVLGMARAVGETMAVAMVIGNVAQMPNSLFTPTAVLTSNIVSQILNVQFDSTWNYALYMMAFILLIISLILIAFAHRLKGERTR